MLGLISRAASRVIVGMELRALGGIGVLLVVAACTDSVAEEAPTGSVAEAIITTQRSASAYPEAVTVKVNNSGQAGAPSGGDFCSGVIVAPRVVLTAAHCVVFNTSNWTVAAPYASGAPSRTVSKGEPFDAGFRDLTRDNFDDHDEVRDLAFLYADTGFNGIAFPTLSATAVSTTGATKVSAIGRASESVTAGLVLSTAQTLGGPLAPYNREYSTPRITGGGDSGGPLFIDGTHTLVGTERVFDDKDHWTQLFDGSTDKTYTAILQKIAANGGYVNLAPTAPKVAPLGTQTFTVSAGAGGTYTYSLTTNNSHGSIDAAGKYKAGATGSVTDVVTGTDSAGRTGSVNVTVGAAVSIAPATQTVAPRGKITFSAKDGSGGGYVYSAGTNGSGFTLSGASYTAGTTGNTTDTVHVVDASGGAADATITVSAGVSIEPENPSTPAKGQITLVAAGGSGSGYAWKLAASPSGGTIDATGHYTAGATSPVNDEATVTDSLGNQQTVEIPVGYPLTIRDAGTVPPRGAVELVAIGGSGKGYVWTISENNSGATLDANGNYVAGTKGNVHDVVMLADSTGAVVTGVENVGAELAITPGDSTVTAGGTLTFAATGGSGTGITFTLDQAPSGGKLEGALYTAGSTGDVTDLVTAHDPLGNTAVTHVAVLPAPAADAGTPDAPAPSADSGCHAAGHGATDGLVVALGLLLVARSRRRRA